MSHSFIADIESGRSNPSLDTLNALAKALDVTVPELIGDNLINNPIPVDKEQMNNLPPEALKEIEDFHAYIRYKYKNHNKKKSKN